MSKNKNYPLQKVSEYGWESGLFCLHNHYYGGIG
jgi:hypothetical protein